MTENIVESFHYEPPTKKRENKGIKRTAAYCRVSTLFEEQELSFETQCQYYEQLIAQNPNMILVGIYGDQGFSGLHAQDRKEFQKLIKDCESDKIDLVLVKSISRFSRNTVECIEYLNRLKAHGVEVYFEKEGLNSNDPQTSMILSIYASMAQNESCSQSENMRWTRQHQAELGTPICSKCYGYKLVMNGKRKNKLIIIEEEAKRVRLAFNLAYQGYSITEILNALIEFEQATGSDYRWIKSRIPFMLSNVVYRGDILTHKYVTLDYLTKKSVKNKGQVDQYYIEQHHEPIVEPKIFDAVQEYKEKGYLNARNVRLRQDWFKEHPEILARRKREGETRWKK